MAFTQDDINKQNAEIEQIKASLLSLQQQEEEIMKNCGFQAKDLVIDFSSLSQEQKNIVAYAKSEAEKFSSQAQTKTSQTSTVNRRRNVITG